SSRPPTEAGSYAVEATVAASNYTGSASGTLVISAAPATVTLDGLAQIYDGNPKPVIVATDPADLAVTVTYNGNSGPPTAVGSYAVEVSVTGSNYVGSATSTLVVAQAIPALTFEFQPSGQISLTWQTSPGWTDQVQYSDDLITWFNDLPSSTFTSDTSPGMTTFLPENDPTVPCRFYRLRRTRSP
ncbi:MBG domain-containing protein, partial [Akkermansiaceae bacterium]|nr:MBG domain-containing protein [Akkermansiaceae bacterium]